MKLTQTKLQIGKLGVTENYIETIKNAFKKHKQIRISILKSVGHTNEKTKEIAEKIKSLLPFKINYKIIGFTIIIRKT